MMVELLLRHFVRHSLFNVGQLLGRDLVCLLLLIQIGGSIAGLGFVGADGHWTDGTRLLRTVSPNAGFGVGFGGFKRQMPGQLP